MTTKIFPQSFDVCIVCALPEETRAVLQVVQSQTKTKLEKIVDSHPNSTYWAVTIKNHKDEPLNLRISCPPRNGLQEMTLHLSYILEEFHPRMIIMTGICAGDKQHVQLGDLIVAERVFIYDSGKFKLDEYGKKIHEHDPLIYQLDATILQFLGLFDDWEAPVAQINYPDASAKQRKIACHVKTMASGNAVRADSPFEDVQAIIRGTVAIDMESAALGLVLNNHPQIPWLVVKGVCDYANREKNDLYHDYTARTSAIYALSLIQAYVTNERLPQRDQPAPQKPIWNVPFPPKQFFTGREALLKRLHTQLQTTRTAAIGQAISGIGGIGKTQLAVEYAYRHKEEYQSVLWANAETKESLTTSYTEIATLLQLPQKAAQEQREIIQGVKDWLMEHQHWLLILDNADEPEVLIPFLPPRMGGHIIVTTRAADLSTLRLGFGHSLTVEKFSKAQDVPFLLRRAGLKQVTSQDRKYARYIADELDGLPLALNQAGVYLASTGRSPASYWKLYQQQRANLINFHHEEDHEYPRSVAQTLLLSIERVEQRNPAAADLLRLCAFLAPDAIPEELLTQEAEEAGGTLSLIASDGVKLDQAIATLKSYSLISRDPHTQALTIHRLVQAVIQDTMDASLAKQYIKQVVHLIDRTFADDDFANQGRLEQLVPHALACASHLKERKIISEKAGHLLNQVGEYIYERGRYEETRVLFQQALTIREQALPASHPDLAESLSNLGFIYGELGLDEEALPLYLRALAMWQETLGPGDTLVATCLGNIAEIYRHKWMYEEALSLNQQALLIERKAHGPNYSKAAVFLNNSALIYEAQGLYEKAQQYFQQALAIWEQSLGSTDILVATCLNNLAGLYREQEKYNEAHSFLQRARSIHELQPNHPAISHYLYNQARLYQAQKQYTLALPLFQQALATWEKALGPSDPQVAKRLNDLAEFY